MESPSSSTPENMRSPYGSFDSEETGIIYNSSGDDGDETSTVTENHALKGFKLFIGLLMLCLLASLAVLAIKPNGQILLFTMFKSSSSESTTTFAAEDTQELGFQRKEYDKLPYWGSSATDAIQYKFLSNFHTLIEPNVDMHFTYYGGYEIDDSSDDYYSYKVYTSSDELASSGYYYMCKSSSKKTSNLNIACTPYDQFRITVLRLDSAGNEKASFELAAVCMYVRRELRSLSSSDLNRTMEAMYTMWSTSDADGLELYGDGYHDAAYFASMHDFNAAWADGDHIHEGLGFLPQHIKMTNLFEASMQAVDPSVSLFYWDFTIEAALDESFYSSPMFTADTFGSLTTSAMDSTDSAWSYKYDSIIDGYIPDGRWKNIPANENQFESLASAYGYMRGPWNTNPAPAITRFAQDDLQIQNIPSCKVYYNWLSDNDVSSFFSTSENAPHASIHGGIGGVFGCDVLDDLYNAGYVGTDATGADYRDDICYKWPFYMKELYRADILTTQEGCQADEALSQEGSVCGFQCDPYKDADIAGVLEGMSLAKYVSNSTDPALWLAFKEFICTGNGFRIFSGDHLESASPADPSFWPIHPTQERLYQAKLMSGGFDEWEWPTETGKGKDWVCNHAECYDYTDLSEEKTKDYYSSCCEGHFEDDQLFDFTKGDRKSKFGLTNREILAATDPTSEQYAVTYIYDSFEWEHCRSHTEYDIKTQMIDLYNSQTGVEEQEQER